MTAVPPPKVLLQPKMSTGVPTTSIPTKKEVMKNLERSIFERPNGRTLMYTTGFLLFTGGLIMAYFGYRAHEFHQKTLAVGNHTIEVQSEELNAWHHSQMVYRGYFSMQFIGK